jgi:hypothetical protein
MSEKESPAEKSIVSLRTQLTAALLAVSLLERKSGPSADSHRLSAHALNALHKLRDELARLDRIVAQLEDREAMQANPLRLKTWRGAEPGRGEPDIR